MITSQLRKAVGGAIAVIALILLPVGTAQAASAGVSGTVNAAGTVYWGTTYRYHASAGVVSMSNVDYPMYCSSGSGFECNWLNAGLRNMSNTQITQTGYTFPKNTYARNFLLPGGSSSIPAAYYAINYAAASSSTGPFPWNWTATYNY
jgi:hypothetical protein